MTKNNFFLLGNVEHNNNKAIPSEIKFIILFLFLIDPLLVFNTYSTTNYIL